MYAAINRYGNDYDEELTGAQVQGCVGDLTVPFPSANGANVKPFASYEFKTNSAVENPKITISNPEFVYRWRYLNQITNNWSTIPLQIAPNEQLVADQSLNLSDGVGDIEYFFRVDVDAPYYEVQDYAFDSSPGFGPGWTEKISAVTNRANYPIEVCPSAGSDYFVRVRPGASDFSEVRVVGKGMAYDVKGKTNAVEEVNQRMELVGDHLWRYHYYVTTNVAGEKLSFHFEGAKLLQRDDGYGFRSVNAAWFSQEGPISALPYTSVAVAGSRLEASVVLDKTSTHLMIEFNDLTGAFSVSHATYQNFNMWTDAVKGFAGYTDTTKDEEGNETVVTNVSTVSDLKRGYTVDFDNWVLAQDSDANWIEQFNITYGDAGFPVDVPFGSHRTPNGWTANNGMFVYHERVAKSGIAFQMEGRGRGLMALDKLGESAMPDGIGSVKFNARVAQSRDFGDFAWYVDGTTFTNYAVSAKINMSRAYNSKNAANPLDVSPAQPSISFVAYYRPYKGCYEFRITRTGPKKLTYQVFKWEFKGDTQTSRQLGKAEKDNLADNQLLVVTGSGRSSLSSAYLSVRNTPAGTVINCGFLEGQNTSKVENSVPGVVLTVTDNDSPFTKGAFGVGSVDCSAVFGHIAKHNLTAAGEISTANVEYSAEAIGAGDWSYSSARYEDSLSDGTTILQGGLRAVMPTNQTVTLQYSNPGKGDNSWKDYEGLAPVIVNSFYTNFYEFTVHSTNTSYVALKAGGTAYDSTRTDVVVDDVQVTSWRAPDSFNLENDMVFAAWDEWVYTEGWLETAAQVSGGTYDVAPVTGTDEYVFKFNQVASMTLKPKKEIVVTELLILGGGGTVFTKEFTDGFVLGTNKTVTIVVGATNKVSQVSGIENGVTYKAEGTSTEVVVSDITGAEIEYGGKPTSGLVILRVRSADKALVLQPSRGTVTYPMSLRSPYLTAGLSMFSFSYQNADTNAVLMLQLCTNIQNVASAQSYTRDRTYSMNSNDWVTVETFTFKDLTAEQRKRGTLSHYMSLREPYHGMMRLLVDPAVKAAAIASKSDSYGEITVTSAYCYDEPKRDNRSWWGWNIHTHGWGADGSSSEWAYLTDSPDGLSCILNFSALKSDNTSAAAKGLGLLVDDEKAYQLDNPFVQSAPLDCGVGAVRFRARQFDPAAKVTEGSDPVVILYGSSEPEAAQTIYPEAWTKIAEFVITNKTYATYEWVSTADSSPYTAVRLEVAGARNGRTSTAEPWETPVYSKALPRQRVCLDEMTVSEPVVPRVALRDVCTFRSGLTDLVPTVIEGISTNLSEQPIVGESWGIYARVEPQQMSDDMDLGSVVVSAMVYRSSSPWGFGQWSNRVDQIDSFELPRVGNELVFRSCASRPESILAPVTTPGSVVQYSVCAHYKDKSGVSHEHRLDSVDWQTPSWYWPVDYNQKYGGGLEDRFAAYGLFDSVSPKRAWINEVNLSDGTKSDNTLYGANCQYIEIAAPAGADLTGWSVNVIGSQVKRGQIVQIGFGGCAESTMKTKNAKDHFIFYAIQSPLTRNANTLEGNADGAWSSSLDSPSDFGMNGDASMTGSRAYGIELMRPTGVIEHQIVIAGTNILAGGFLEYLGSGTNLASTLQQKDYGGNGTWFYTGEDAYTGTLGVIAEHGESESCWTNRLDVNNFFNPEKIQGTPGKINSFGGVEQTITPNWFLTPNGTNVWIYPSVEGGNLVQILGGKTNTSAVIVMQQGGSTNIQYLADKWYEVGDVKVTVGDKSVSTNVFALGDRRWEVRLENVSTNMDVVASAKISGELETKYGVDPDDSFTPAIMDWLLREHGDSPSEEIHLAELLDLRHNFVTNLTLKNMYWLNINPVEKGWALVFGFGALPDSRRSSRSIKSFVPVEVGKDANGKEVTNTTMLVTMMITNKLTNVAYAPNTLRGVEPGSTSSSLTPATASGWKSTTLKVTGALQRPGDENADIRKKYLPLRWFVLGPDSFDPVTYTAEIEILEPHQTNSPGYWYGWDAYPDVPIWYKLKLDGDGPGNDSVKILEAKDLFED